MAVAADLARADADHVAAQAHALYTRFGPQIEAYCRYKLRSREEAEDAVQTTFMNAFRALKRGTATHAEQAWLFKIAQNVCAARQSSSTRRLRLEKPDDFQTLQEIIPSPASSGADELIGLEDVLAGMPENQRRAILLREWQGLSYREIGEELDLSQASVEMLIFRARRALARGLERQQPAPRAERRMGRRLGQGLDLGGIVAALKSLFVGGAAMKAVGVTLTAGTVAAVAALGAHKPVAPPPAAPSARVPSHRAANARPAATTAAAREAPTARVPLTARPDRPPHPTRPAKPVSHGVFAPAVQHDTGVDPPLEGTAQAAATSVPAPATPSPPAAPVAAATVRPPAPAPAAPSTLPAPRQTGAPRVGLRPPAVGAAAPPARHAEKQHGDPGRKAQQTWPATAHVPAPPARRSPDAERPAAPGTHGAHGGGKQPGGGAPGDGNGRGSAKPPVADVPADPSGAAPPSGAASPAGAAPPVGAAPPTAPDPPSGTAFAPPGSSASVQAVPAAAASAHGHSGGGNGAPGHGAVRNGVGKEH